jgi:hypothetical protein
VATAVGHAKAGDLIALGHAYAEKPAHELLLDVRADDFDPASADPELA